MRTAKVYLGSAVVISRGWKFFAEEFVVGRRRLLKSCASFASPDDISLGKAMFFDKRRKEMMFQRLLRKYRGTCMWPCCGWCQEATSGS